MFIVSVCGEVRHISISKSVFLSFPIVLLLLLQLKWTPSFICSWFSLFWGPLPCRVLSLERRWMFLTNAVSVRLNRPLAIWTSLCLSSYYGISREQLHLLKFASQVFHNVFQNNRTKNVGRIGQKVYWWRPVRTFFSINSCVLDMTINKNQTFSLGRWLPCG